IMSALKYTTTTTLYTLSLHDALPISIDPVRLAVIRIVEERDINLDRGGSGRRESVLGDGAEDRLTSDDEYVRIIGDLRRRPQHMFQLLTPHAARSWRQHEAKEASTAWRSTSGSTPANGEFCRSSTACGDREVSTSRTASTPSSSTTCQRSSHTDAI